MVLALTKFTFYTLHFKLMDQQIMIWKGFFHAKLFKPDHNSQHKDDILKFQSWALYLLTFEKNGFGMLMTISKQLFMFIFHILFQRTSFNSKIPPSSSMDNFHCLFQASQQTTLANVRFLSFEINVPSSAKKDHEHDFVRYEARHLILYNINSKV